MTTQNNLASAVVDSNESAKNGIRVFSISKGGVGLNVQPEGPFDSLENFATGFAETQEGVAETKSEVGTNIGQGVVGVVKGVPRGIFNFAEEFNRTFLPGYNENVVPWMNENIPGLKDLNDFTATMLEYDNNAQTIGGQFIGEPVGEFVVPGATISRGAQAMGMGSKFLANVLGYGATEAIAVPADEQAMISMGLDLALPNSKIKSLILEGLQADEDAAYIIQKLQKAPENFLGGGYLGEKLDQAISGIGALYTRIKNSPKLNEMKNNVTESLIKAGDDAQARIDENKGSTQLNMGMDPTALTDQGLALIGKIIKGRKQEGTLKSEFNIENAKAEIEKIARQRSGVDPSKNVKIKIEDIQGHLDEAHNISYGRPLDFSNADDRKLGGETAAKEILTMLTKPVSGKGWYDDDIVKTFKSLAGIPGAESLRNNETHRVIWSAISGAMSNGNDVPMNTRIGTAQFLKWIKTGKLDTSPPPPGTTIEGVKNAGFGRRGTGVGQSLGIIQFLLDKFGEEGFADFWLSPHSLKELTDLRIEAGLKGGPSLGGKQGDLHLGAKIIGDKTGNFSMNINGYDAATKDIWFTRGIRRYEGTFKTKGRLPDGTELGQPKNISDRQDMEAFIEELQNNPALKELNLSKQDIQAILWYNEQNLYTELGVKSRPKSFSEGAETLNDLKPEGSGIQRSDVVETEIEQTDPELTKFRSISRRKRAVRQNRRIQQLNNSDGDGTASQPYGEESQGDVGLYRGVTFEPNPEVLSRYNEAGLNIPRITNVETSANVDDYVTELQRVIDTHPFGGQVSPQTPETLKDAKLYRTEHGGGFAITSEGDIVGVFNGANNPPKTIYATLQLAIREGGTHLDAFNTMLPDVYETVGFKPVARLQWNDEFAPDNWNKETFAEYNNGEPDIVFFVHDPNYFGGVNIEDLPVSSSYDEAKSIQMKLLDGGDDG